MIAVTVAWGAKYRALVPRWRASVAGARLEAAARVLIRPAEPKAREDAWSLWPKLILRALEAGPVLKMDVDGLIRSLPPWPEGVDFAARRATCGKYWEVGALAAWPTSRARAVLERWGVLMRKRARPWVDCIPFTEALQELGAVVSDLGPRFGWNRAWYDHDRFPGAGAPWIEFNT